jgi:hypothetical protein
LVCQRTPAGKLQESYFNHTCQTRCNADGGHVFALDVSEQV